MVRSHCQMLVSKWSSAFKKGRETEENEPHERRPRTSITGENSARVDAVIRENRRIIVRELSGILNISDGSVKDSHQKQERTSVSFLQNNSRPNTWLLVPWTPSRNWNGTFYHILHIVRTLLPQTITSSAPLSSIWAEKGFAIMRKSTSLVI